MKKKLRDAWIFLDQTFLELNGIVHNIPGQGEFVKCHPDWGQEITKPKFTVLVVRSGQTKEQT